MVIANTPEQRLALVTAMSQLRKKVRGRTAPYQCFLDEQPSNLVPDSVQRIKGSSIDAADLIVNPSFLFQTEHDSTGKSAPLALPSNVFLTGYPVAWVRDLGHGLWTPYWVRHAWEDLLGSLEAGRPAPQGLAPTMLKTLRMANIFVPRGFEKSGRQRWARVCAVAQRGFRSQGYAVVQDLIHPFQLGAMRVYYRDLIAGGGLQLGDSQVRDRYCLHGEELAKVLHAQLTPVVRRIVGEPVMPSYVYFASYRPGADLPPHVDRAQCEFSISLLADYSPEPSGPSGWPLFLEKPGEPKSTFAADLCIGDALFYKGRELVHFRQPLPAGHQSTSVFFHYVRPDFAGRMW